MTLAPFLRQLAGLCHSHPTRAKWVIVASHALGLTLGSRLARDAGDWANLRFVTPLDLATRMAAPFLLERGIEPSEEKLGAALVMRLLLALPEPDGYFRGMAEHTSMADALWRAIRELRYAGLRAGDLAARRFTALPRKQAELTALLASYERYLDSAGVADMPLVFEEAARHREWSPVKAGDLVVQLPWTPWPPVVARFLECLPGERVAPEREAREGVGRLFERAPLSRDLFRAGGRDAEMDEVFRRIARSGLPLDQVEIACAAGVPASLPWEKAERLGWPVTLSAGLPAAMTRPGRLLLRFCDWVESGLEAAELRRLLQSGDCWGRGFGGAPAAGEEPDLSTGQAARLLLKARATWGRGTYGPALNRLAGEYERRAADTEASEEDRAWSARKGRQSRALLSWVSRALDRLPPAACDPSGTVRVTALLEAAVSFLLENAARWSRFDALAVEAVTGALEDLRSLGDHECPSPAALRYLRERVASLTVGRERPRPGHLHVSTLRDAGHDGRPLAFVVGLEEGAVFSAPVEDAVLLDDERLAFAPLLQTSVERQAEEVRQVRAGLETLAAAASRLCLSYSCRDTREFRETFPSWIVLEAFRLQQGDAALTYQDLQAHLGDPVSAVARSPEAALSDGAWWLAHGGHVARDEILRAFPSLQRGLEAVEQRASDEFTEYDGFVPDAGRVLDPSRSGRAVSATTLEKAAKCPLRFFMEHGLGVRPLEEGKADEDGWLSPLTRGSELHALYARLSRAARGEKRKPTLSIDQPRLRAWGVQRLEELHAEMPPPSEEVYLRESREFLEDLDAFIAAECEGRHGREPVGFEVPFGFPIGEGEEEPLASEDLLEIDIGQGRRLSLHGRIDRINRLGPREYEVADYKGSYWRDAWQGVFAGGTRLQHALYGAAAQQVLRSLEPKARVVRGTYLFPSVKGHGASKAIEAPKPADLAAVLRDLADVIGGGAFAPADQDSACAWCEFTVACHAVLGEPSTSTGAKVGDPDNAALEAYRRLRLHK